MSMMMPAAAWPVELRHQSLTLRPLRRRDEKAWRESRSVNAQWLQPWESTSPDGPVHGTFGEMVRANKRMARLGQGLSFGIFVEGAFAGQITLSCVAWGSLRSGSIGYWIDERMAGRGITPTAVALLTDHAFGLGLHRIEINIRPENHASLRVVDKLGFRDEGLRRRYLHINGVWADHRSFALTADEVPSGLLRRWLDR